MGKLRFVWLLIGRSGAKTLPSLFGSLFSDTTDGVLRRKLRENEEKGIRRPSEMAGGRNTRINYLSYKFCCFAK